MTCHSSGAAGRVRNSQVIGPRGVGSCPDPHIAGRGILAFVADARTALTILALASCAIPETSDEPLGSGTGTGPAIWTVDPLPIWSLPDESQGLEYSFHLARGLRRLPDGTVVLINAGTPELRAFAPDGQLLWRTGTAGDGPGDFRSPRWILPLPGDTLMVGDGQLNRVSYFSTSGEFVRAERLTDELACGPEYPGLRDRLMVVADCAPPSSWAPGLQLRDRHLTLVSPALPGGRRRLAKVAATEMMVGPGQRYWFPPFGLSGVVAAQDSLIFYGTGEQFAVEVYSISGRRLRTIGLARPRQPVTDEIKAEWHAIEARRMREFILQRGGTPRVEEGGQVSETVFRDSVPAFGEFRVDPDLNLWIGEYVLTGRQPVRWTVLSAEGDWLAEVTVPDRFRIWEVGRDYLLGVWRDDDDVERIHMYRVRRQP